MRVVVTGAGGQLGRDLAGALRAHETVLLPHDALDVTDAAAVDDAFSSASPQAIVHAGRNAPGNGDVYNVLDDELMSCREFFRRYRREVEGLRSKLKRLVTRGRLTEDSPGMFAVTRQITWQAAEPEEPGPLR